MSIRVITALFALGIAIAAPARAQKSNAPLAPPAFSAAASSTTQAKQFRLGGLSISGNKHTKLFVILRMIPLSPGEIFNQSLWEFGLEQINRSGLFEPIQPGDVVIKPDDATGIVDVELHLKERDHQRIDVNGGGGTTGGASIGLDYSNINLTGRGDRLVARARIGTREQSGGADYSSMLYGRLPLSFEVGGFYQRLLYVNATTLSQGREPLFIQRTGGVNLGVFLPLDRSRYTIAATTRVGIVYSFTTTNLADTVLLATSSPTTLTQKGLRVGTLTPLLLRDTLDRELDPSRGERLVIGAELGARALGGSLNFFKPYVDYRRFFPISRKNDDSHEPMAIGFRVRASHIRAFGKPFSEQALSTVRGVPVFRRVFLGGETELRGYDVNSVAPLARVERFIITEGNAPALLSSEVRPVGGDTELLFNAEYRVPIVWRLSSAAFFDLGSSFNSRSLVKESFDTTTQLQSTGEPITLRTVLRPLNAGEDILPRYRLSLGGELRFPIPILNIPLRLIVAWNPNAQKHLPDSALLAPEKRFTFRVGFSRTL